ncbi:hypothetical protein [Streptomyces sp. NPDC014733]|uniref:hypothetical protein n=1 Tax=Streptomyces sp. NPDC014733 TaxID=3364885 RepID=UPI0036FC0FF2
MTTHHIPPAPAPQQRTMSPAPRLLGHDVLLPLRRPAALCARCEELRHAQVAARARGDASEASDLTVRMNRCTTCCPR